MSIVVSLAFDNTKEYEKKMKKTKVPINNKYPLNTVEDSFAFFSTPSCPNCVPFELRISKTKSTSQTTDNYCFGFASVFSLQWKLSDVSTGYERQKVFDEATHCVDLLYVGLVELSNRGWETNETGGCFNVWNLDSALALFLVNQIPTTRNDSRSSAWFWVAKHCFCGQFWVKKKNVAFFSLFDFEQLHLAYGCLGTRKLWFKLW